MIKAIRSNHEEFKTITFDSGFNVILADRVEGASDRDSRNGLGKTTILEIIHFCLGTKPSPNEGLRIPQLENWTFTLDLTLRDKDFSISRNTSEHTYVSIKGDFSDWPIIPEIDNEKNIYTLKIDEWNKVLGSLLFGLRLDYKQKYQPTFRSLISYSIRKGIASFTDPFKHHPNQKEWDIQVNNSYLIGLNWEYASAFQDLKDKKNLLDNLKKASQQGILSDFTGTIGELEAEKVRFSEEYFKMEEDLSTFKVHPQYYKIQEDANSITDRIHNLTNKLTIDQQILSQYEKSIAAEKDISIDKVAQVYEKAGLSFSEKITKKLSDIQQFHNKIIENRKTYLTSEMDRLTREITEVKNQIERLSDDRAKVLGILKSHGALDEYNKLQQRKTHLEKTIEDISKKISDLKKIEDYKSELTIQREELLKRARTDFEERTTRVTHAQSFFNQDSQALYNEPGILSIDITEAGYKFKVEIRRANSQGVGYMKVFCYDLTLLQLHSQEKSIMPDFLIHDSTIFDGVDERQIAKALELAFKQSKELGFQYICALNSDIVPYEDFSTEFKADFDKSVKAVLSDKTEDGGLLGIRY